MNGTGRERRGRLTPRKLIAITALGLTAFGATLVGGADARSPATPVVINEAFRYRPGTFHVKAGTRIVFENQSSYTHTATDEGVFNTKNIKPGASKGIALKEKGTFVFHCELHPFMIGKVIVE